jgi:quaternary ammonium compound-resistance protein SugE
MLAGLLEVGFTTALRMSEGFTKLGPSLVFLICSALSFLSLQKATGEIPLGTAYAVWVGIGAAGTLLVGVALFNEPVSIPRFVFLTTLVFSIIGLRVFSP